MNLANLLHQLDILPSKLADDLDISRGYVSELMSGKKMPSPNMAKRIADYLGVTIGEIFDQPATSGVVPGFAEGEAAPFRFNSAATLKTLVSILAPKMRHPNTYVVTRALPCFGLLPGDIMLVDSKIDAVAGDIVMATEWLDTGSARTHVCQWAPPYLIPGTAGERLLKVDAGNGEVAILGKMCASYRPATDSQ